MKKEKSYLVESIEFDFDDGNNGESYPIDQEEKDFITHNTLGVWYAYDDEHLIDRISDKTGWTIKSIEYGDNRPHALTSFM